jgi:LacI family transcriptional regulator
MLRDVARLAGVSVGTASKALNDRQYVSPETRERVLRIAESLGFRPNKIAQSLNGRRSGSIGLLTNWLAFSLPVLTGIEDSGGAQSLSVLLCDARGDPIRERHHLLELQDRRVDGIVVVGRKTNPRPSITADLSVPVVYVYTPSEDPADASFVPDDEAGGKLATRHLLDSGRRRIAYVGGNPEWLASTVRGKAFEDVMRDAGLRPAGMLYNGNWTMRWGRAAADMLLNNDPGIDAIFCASDRVAAGLLESLHERGVRCPDDIAVVGFDNHIIFGEDTHPPLTTVDMNLPDLGSAAVRALIAALDGHPDPGLHLQPCHLVIRESAAPARATRAGQ